MWLWGIGQERDRFSGYRLNMAMFGLRDIEGLHIIL